MVINQPMPLALLPPHGISSAKHEQQYLLMPCADDGAAGEEATKQDGEQQQQQQQQQQGEQAAAEAKAPEEAAAEKPAPLLLVPLVRRLYEVLRGVDFEVTSEKMIRRQLEQEFGRDLSEHKKLVKKHVSGLLHCAACACLVMSGCCAGAKAS
jgi:hypothetical protein